MSVKKEYEYISYLGPDMPILSLKAEGKSIASIDNILVPLWKFHDPNHMKNLMISAENQEFSIKVYNSKIR